MARKPQPGGVNKSQAIREVLQSNPAIKAKEAISLLRQRGITVTSGLFYLTKGRVEGSVGSRRYMRRNAAAVTRPNGAASTGAGDAVTTIRKVKALAAEVGGLKKLTALVEALSQ
jgi:hypothetical protein